MAVPAVDSDAALIEAGRRAWDALREQRQPGLVARDKVADRHIAACLLERWLMRCTANGN